MFLEIPNFMLEQMLNNSYFFLWRSYTHPPLLTLLGITLPLPTGRVPTSHSALLARDLATGKYLMRSRLQMNRGENISVARRKDIKEGRKRMDKKRLVKTVNFSSFWQKVLLQIGNPTQETRNT